MNIFEYIANVEKNLNDVKAEESAKEYLAIYSIAEALSVRYAEIAGDYNCVEDGNQKTAILDEAVQKIEEIVSQDFSRAMYDEYMTLPAGSMGGAEQ